MNIALKRIGLVLLLAGVYAGTPSAFAQSGWSGYGFRAVADERNQYQDRRNNAEPRPSSRPNEDYPPRRAERPPRYHDDARLSPEERRALRRQIDEAGRDIYVPRR